MSAASRPRRVMFVEGNPDGTIGGSFFSLLFLAASLDRSRYDPVVVFMHENSLLPRFAAEGVRTLVRPKGKVTRLTGRLGALIGKLVNFVRGWVLEPIRIAALLRRERVAVLHLNNSITGNHDWMLAARLARIPCLTHQRGINDRYEPRARWLARGLRGVICISRAVREHLEEKGFAHLPLVTIANGLDAAQMRVTRPPHAIRAELGLPEHGTVIGIVGNIKQWKGQGVVIDAMREVVDEFPGLICLLIGDTSPSDIDYRRKIDAQIIGAGLVRCVRITGFRSDVANYVNLLDVQIHASVEPEPFGRVLLEAMALRKPLVASSGGAVPEIVVDGVTGLLFDPGNPASLAAQLKVLLRDPARRVRMGEAGHARLLEYFTIARNTRATEALYDELLGS
jgi:glycosyltransferase involved in cell wall biosynthesis